MATKKSITLSKKYGVNPSIVVCPICKKDTSIALFGHLKGDVEAPHIVEGDLCDDCKKKYATMIEVESETNKKATGRRGFILKEALNVKGDTFIMGHDEFDKIFKDNA